MNSSQTKDRQTFDLWLMDFVARQPSASIDAALQSYIKEHDLVVRQTLDEPPQVTDVRTRLAILEESGLLDPANSRDTDLRNYADSLRSMLEVYSHMSPAARAALARRATKEWPRWQQVLAVLGVAIASAFGIWIAMGLSVWLVFGVLCGVAAFKFSRSENRFTDGMATWLALLVCVAALGMGRYWYWHFSPLVSAKQKCEELRRLWTHGQQREAIDALKDLAENQQEWEQSSDDYDHGL